MARKTVEDLMNLVRPVRDRSFPYEKMDPERRKWSHYDDAKVNETADVLETIGKLWTWRHQAFWKGRGQPVGLRYLHRTCLRSSSCRHLRDSQSHIRRIPSFIWRETRHNVLLLVQNNRERLRFGNDETAAG